MSFGSLGTWPNRGYGRDSSAVRPCGMHEAGGAGRQGGRARAAERRVVLCARPSGPAPVLDSDSWRTRAGARWVQRRRKHVPPALSAWSAGSYAGTLRCRARCAGRGVQACTPLQQHQAVPQRCVARRLSVISERLKWIIADLVGRLNGSRTESERARLATHAAGVPYGSWTTGQHPVGGARPCDRPELVRYHPVLGPWDVRLS